MKKRKCEYVNFVAGPWEQLVLEPEDWTEDEWKTILKLFGLENAERIMISDYTLKAYGMKKGEEHGMD